MLSGKVEFALFNVDGNDGGASARSGEGTGEKTDGTSADDKDSRTRTEVSSSVSVENDGEGFGKSSEGEFKVRGELVNQFSRPRHDLSQCPVQMRVGLRRACESHVRTKVVPAPSAHLTGLAVDTNFHSDPVTDFEVETGVDIRADSGDDTTGFVTEDEGFSNLESAVRTVEVVVEVRSTHARHCHLDLHLIRLGLGDIPLFDSQINSTVADDGLLALLVSAHVIGMVTIEEI